MGRTKECKRKAAGGDDTERVVSARLLVATSLAAHHAALGVGAASRAGAAGAAAQDEEAADEEAGASLSEPEAVPIVPIVPRKGASKAPGKKMLYSQALERARASEAAALADVEALSLELTRARRELRKLHAAGADAAFAAALARARDGVEGASGSVEQLHNFLAEMHFFVDGGSISELEDICLTTGSELKKVRDALTQLAEAAAVAQAAAETEGLRPAYMQVAFDATRAENAQLRVQLQDMEARFEFREATIANLEGDVKVLKHDRLRMWEANEKLRGYNLEVVDTDELDQQKRGLQEALARTERAIERRACEATVAGKMPAFKCPISDSIMRQPVVAADGHTYEEGSIKRWFVEHGASAKSPLAGQPLGSTQTVPNHTLRKAIEEAVDAEVAARARAV